MKISISTGVSVATETLTPAPQKNLKSKGFSSIATYGKGSSKAHCHTHYTLPNPRHHQFSPAMTHL